MSTTTQFQQLTKPATTDLVDINVLDANLDKLDKIGFVLCTSATRPTTNLFNGLRIFETDTLLEYVYTGAVWRGIPAGRIGGVSTPAGSTTYTAEASVTSSAFSFTTVSGRRYRITMRGLMRSTVAGDQAQMNLRDAGSSAITIAAPTILQINAALSTVNSIFEIVQEFDCVTGNNDIAAGVQNCGLYVLRSAGTGTVTLTAAAVTKVGVLVEDIGSVA